MPGASASCQARPNDTERDGSPSLLRDVGAALHAPGTTHNPSAQVKSRAQNRQGAATTSRSSAPSTSRCALRKGRMALRFPSNVHPPPACLRPSPRVPLRPRLEPADMRASHRPVLSPERSSLHLEASTISSHSQLHKLMARLRVDGCALAAACARASVTAALLASASRHMRQHGKWQHAPSLRCPGPDASLQRRASPCLAHRARSLVRSATR